MALLLALPAAEAVAGPWLPAPGEYYTEFQGVRSNATQFRDDGGGSRDLFKDAEVERRSLEGIVELGWKPKWSIVLGAPFQNETVHVGPGHNLTETAFGDFTFAVRRSLIAQGSSAMAVQAEWIAPLGFDRLAEMRAARLALLQNASTDTLDVSLADSSLSAAQPGQRLGARLSYGASLPGLDAFFIGEVGAHYMFNAEDLEIFGASQLGFWPLDDLFIGVTYDLAFSRDYPFVVRHVPDEDGNVKVETETRPQSQQLVGPKIVFRVDDNLDVVAGSRHLVAGRNTFGPNEFYVGVAFKQTSLNRLQGFLGGTARP